MFLDFCSRVANYHLGGFGNALESLKKGQELDGMNHFKSFIISPIDDDSVIAWYPCFDCILMKMFPLSCSVGEVIQYMDWQMWREDKT